MEDDLPTEYDVVVVGTGMTESIVAAATSRIGKKVLHLDSNEYYGGLWASFNFDGFQTWRQKMIEPKSEGRARVEVEAGEKFLKASNQYSTVENFDETWFIPNDTDLPDLSTKESQTASETEDKNSDLPDLSTKESRTEEKEETESKSDENEETKCESEKQKETESESEEEKEPPGVRIEYQNKTQHWTIDRFSREHRRFNIDLTPKLLFARGDLVELLISSNIARYAEFRAVSRVATFMDGKLTQVPCSRADVFANKTVSVVEKRMLMQLLMSCMEQGAESPEFDGYRDKTFLEYLNTKNLTPMVKHYVMQAIAMATEKTSCREGVNRTKHFLTSLGRYGNTPFLWPMYGSGELPQCFCRLSAVFGGIYCLNRQVDGIVVTEDKCKAIISGQQRLSLDHLVIGQDHLPPEIVESPGEHKISRGIFIIDRSIMQGEKENLTLLYYPPEEPGQEPVTLIELGPSTHACPPGLFVLHMTCKRTTTAKEDLAYVVKKFFAANALEPNVVSYPTDVHTQTGSENSHLREAGDAKDQQLYHLKPHVLWSIYLNLPASDIKLSDSAPKNLHLCSGPDLDLDFDFAVTQAREIFNTMYPGEEFLPRAPDPEEIVPKGDQTPGPKFDDVAEAEDVSKEA